MARRTNQTGLTDDIQEEEEPSVATTKTKTLERLDDDLSFKNEAEAEAGIRAAIELLEKAHTWSLENNLPFIGIVTTHARKPKLLDNKQMTISTEDGKQIPAYEDPNVSIQIRLGLSSRSISLPLHQAIIIPKVGE
jgi:hypothetical protein